MISKFKHWNKFYHKRRSIQKNSKFSNFCLSYLKNFKGDIVDVGCGDGRDLVFFYKNNKKVIGIDSSLKAVDLIKKKYSKYNLSLINKSFCKVFFDKISSEYAIYSRFSIHAITSKEEKLFFRNLAKSKNVKFLFIETRTIEDDFFGKGIKISSNEYIFGHYRRFINPKDLIKKIKKLNFKILYAESKKNFAKFKKENPCVLRIVAKKK